MSTSEQVRKTVREGYAAIANAGVWNSGQTDETADAACCGGGCCGQAPTAEFDAAEFAEQIGYDAEALSTLPDGANMGLSCGNPGAIAALKEGEVVLDLGAGGGFDVFLASVKVGATGRAIGVDMTAEMVSKARANAESHERATGLTNVEFRLGEIEALPVADASVDVVISNCVLNLSPDKPRTWREIARVLKPGGRVAVSDLALLKPLPDAVRGMLDALVGCVAGADLIDTVRRDAEAAGLRDVTITPKPEYVRTMESFQDPLYRRMAEALPKGETMADYLTSADITARR